MMETKVPTGQNVSPKRINLDPDQAENGLVQLVLAIVELIRQLLERQAVRRMEGGGLTDEECEKLGENLMHLEEQMNALKAHFHVTDLNIDLGPLGRLLDSDHSSRDH